MKRKLPSRPWQVLRGGLATILAVLLASGTSFPACQSERITAGALTGGCERTPLGVANVGEGRAWVNQAPLMSGATLYAGDRVHVGEKATASMQLASGLVLLAPGSELTVQATGVRMEHGLIQVRQKTGATLAIEAQYFRVQLVPVGGKAAAAEVSVDAVEGRVVPMFGMAEVVAAGEASAYRVKSGEAAVVKWSGPGEPERGQSAGAQAAGEVSRLLPEVSILRGPRQWAAAVQSPVEWNDELRSSRGGRARVSLHDGSTLNLGSESSLRVVRHDAGAQQTELELSYGRLRSRVVRVARPGGKFEVRTPVGVAGVVGTDFYLFSDASGTILIVFEGEVRLTSLVTGQVLLALAGQKIVVAPDGTMSGPVQATPEEIRQAQSSTDVPEEEALGRKAQAAGGRVRAPVVIMVTGVVTATILGVWLTHREPSSPSTPFGPPN